MASDKRSAKRRAGSAVTSTLALPTTPSPNIPARELTREIISKRVRNDDTVGRRRYGSATDMVQIASAIENANQGRMADLCDLESEILTLDPTLASYASKRFGALQAADWDVTPPAGLTGSDRAYGAKIATDLHRVLTSIDTPQAIFDLAWSLYDGRGAIEVAWEMGAWGMRCAPIGFDWVHPRRLAFGALRELRVVDPQRMGSFSSQEGFSVEDTPAKFLFWKPRLFREHHEREGLGPRSLYWAFFKRFGWRLRMRLTELFAIPWRIIELDQETVANAPSIEQARDEVDELSGDTSAVMPAGTKLSIEWPDEQSGELFTRSHEDCNTELAKLWLGNTATTQQGEGARAEGIIGKGEQDIIYQRDGRGLSARWRPLAQTFTRVNYGDMAEHLTPTIQLRTQPQRDRDKELARARTFMGFGLPIAEADLREMSGFRAPLPDERFARLGASGGTDMMGNPLPGAIEIVDPTATANEDQVADAASRIEITPTDVATVVTVNEARASQGLPPIDGPDGDLTLPEFQAKHADVIAHAAAAVGGSEDAPVDGAPGAQAAPKPEEDKPTREERGTDGQAEDAVRDALGLTARGRLCCEAQAGIAVPAAAVHGSPETLIARGVKEAVRETSKWAAARAAAVDGLSDAVSIRRALSRVKIDREAFARAVEKRLVHGAMLGAMDAEWEAENDRVVKPPAFSIKNDRRVEETEEERLERWGIKLAGGVVDFVASPFAEALRIFRAKNILPRRAFDRLSAEAKRYAFTVAGLAEKAQLEAAHSELSNALEEGDDLRRFSARLTERFESAGWTTPNPSHVETIFRTNTMSAYARGRDEQMTQPAVLAARPYWQIMGPNDSRKRDPHRRALGKVLEATDPFWKRAPLPWGYNCRDRKVSRSARDVERLGLEVVSGASLTGLPDEGWDASGGF